MLMPKYDPELTLRDARTLYFEINNFKDGGYDDRWVKMKAGPIPIAFPNTSARVRAVKYHDLHHVLTEYSTTWAGEAEIGAWEVSTGCARHYPAWLLNLWAFAIGLAINPLGVYRAFLRGRQSSNLYRRAFDEELLSNKVGVVRRELHLDRAVEGSSIMDKISFAFWAWISVITLGAPYLVGVAAFILMVLWIFG